MSDMKYMTLQEFIDNGLLFHVNRIALHPLGLALEMVLDDAGKAIGIERLWDCRDDPEGIAFEEETFEKGRAKWRRFMEEEIPKDYAQKREQLLGYYFQGYVEDEKEEWEKDEEKTISGGRRRLKLDHVIARLQFRTTLLIYMTRNDVSPEQLAETSSVPVEVIRRCCLEDQPLAYASMCRLATTLPDFDELWITVPQHLTTVINPPPPPKDYIEEWNAMTGIEVLVEKWQKMFGTDK